MSKKTPRDLGASGNPAPNKAPKEKRLDRQPSGVGAYIAVRLANDGQQDKLPPLTVEATLTIAPKPLHVRPEAARTRSTKPKKKTTHVNLSSSEKDAIVTALHKMSKMERSQTFEKVRSPKERDPSGRTKRKLYNKFTEANFDLSKVEWAGKGQPVLLTLADLGKVISTAAKHKQLDKQGDVPRASWDEYLLRAAEASRMRRGLQTARQDSKKGMSRSSSIRYDGLARVQHNVQKRAHPQHKTMARYVSGCSFMNGMSFMAVCLATLKGIHPSMVNNVDPSTFTMGLAQKGAATCMVVADHRTCYVLQKKEQSNPRNIKWIPCGSATGATGRSLFSFKVGEDELPNGITNIHITCHGVRASSDPASPSAILLIHHSGFSLGAVMAFQLEHCLGPLIMSSRIALTDMGRPERDCSAVCFQDNGEFKDYSSEESLDNYEKLDCAAVSHNPSRTGDEQAFDLSPSFIKGKAAAKSKQIQNLVADPYFEKMIRDGIKEAGGKLKAGKVGQIVKFLTGAMVWLPVAQSSASGRAGWNVNFDIEPSTITPNFDKITKACPYARTMSTEDKAKYEEKLLPKWTATMRRDGYLLLMHGGCGCGGVTQLRGRWRW